MAQKDLNSVKLMGNVANELVMRRTTKGIPCVDFTIAAHSSAGETVRTDYVDCVAWRSLAEFMEKKVKKGTRLVVEGRLETQKWTDKNGNKRRSTIVVAEEIYFVGSKKDTTDTAE